MSRRIDIELTSTRDDGAWTWRAAGARQPKGTVDASLIPGDTSVGDVLRAEVETSIDGTTVLSVAPPKGSSPEAADRIELISRTLRDDELVIETRTRRRRRDRDDRDDRRGRGRRRDGERRGRSDRDGDRRGRADREGGRGRGRGRDDRRDRGDGSRNDRPRREPSKPLRPKAKRLRPARTHRSAALTALSEHERVVAEQVLQGGIPAVRKGVEKMNEQARAQGQPEIKPDALVDLAERLLPDLRTAEWRDRADAALADIDELDLRDLRSVVVASDQGARDDETREMAAKLREGLERRVEDEQTRWLADIVQTLEEGRTVRALRLSSRPPKAGAPLPADLASRLATATTAGLTADTHPDRWMTVLDALSYSPVRLTVAPESKPDEPGEELVATITRLAYRVPRVAEAFGIEVPAEEPRRRSRGGRRGKRGKGGAKDATTPTATKTPGPAPAAPAGDAEAASEKVDAPVEQTPKPTPTDVPPSEAPAESAVTETPAEPEAPATPEAQTPPPAEETTPSAEPTTTDEPSPEGDDPAEPATDATSASDTPSAASDPAEAAADSDEAGA